MKLKQCLTAVAVTTLIASNAWATNGYRAHGIGQKAKGMGGAGIAFPQDALAAGYNPAGMVTLGNRFDIGVEYFRPQREFEISGNIPQWNQKADGDDTQHFIIPELGYNRMLNDRMSLGVSMYGNGGMNTNYGDGVTMFNNGTGNRTGIDFAQLFIVPAFSWKMGEDNSFGIGINLVGQRLKVNGIESFDNAFISQNPGQVNDRSYSYSVGAGLRAGWLGKIHDRVTLGIAGQTRTWMSKFSKYRGLLADDGDMDVPASIGAGIAVQASSKLIVTADVEKTFYSEVNSIGNGGPITNSENCLSFVGGAKLGNKDGCGFGWQDQWVYKLGLSYAFSPQWTLRAGYNYGASPINNEETLMNILAPATVEHHLTLGGTWAFNPDMELSFHYMHAFSNKIEGSNSIPATFNGGEADIKMYQDSFGIAFGWKL